MLLRQLGLFCQLLSFLLPPSVFLSLSSVDRNRLPNAGNGPIPALQATDACIFMLSPTFVIDILNSLTSSSHNACSFILFLTFIHSLPSLYIKLSYALSVLSSSQLSFTRSNNVRSRGLTHERGRHRRSYRNSATSFRRGPLQ